MLIRSTLVGFVLLGSTVALSSFSTHGDNMSQRDIDQINAEYCEHLSEQKYPDQADIEQCEIINKTKSQQQQHPDQQQQLPDQQQQYPDHQQYPEQDQNEQIPINPVHDKDQVGDYDYGTARWVDYGEYNAYKLFEKEVVIRLHGQQVNEISLFATNSMIEIKSAYAYLSNGDVMDLTPVLGTYVAEGFTVRSQLIDSRPLAVKKIVLSIKASDFKVVNHGKLRVSVGFAR